MFPGQVLDALVVFGHLRIKALTCLARHTPKRHKDRLAGALGLGNGFLVVVIYPLFLSARMLVIQAIDQWGRLGGKGAQGRCSKQCCKEYFHGSDFFDYCLWSGLGFVGFVGRCNLSYCSFDLHLLAPGDARRGRDAHFQSNFRQCQLIKVYTILHCPHLEQ